MDKFDFTSPSALAEEISISPHDDINGFNRSDVEEACRKKVVVYASDLEGSLVAGAMGELKQNHLDIADLWVSKTARNQGVGRKLLDMLEHYARNRGLVFTRLNTVSPQALEFYCRQGYRILKEHETAVPDTKRYYLQKQVIELQKHLPSFLIKD